MTLTETDTEQNTPARPSEIARAASLFTLVGVELRKATDTRASRWLLAIIIGIGLLASVIPLFFLGGDDVVFTGMLGNSMMGVYVLLPIVALMMVTSEWSARSAMTTFTLVPRRGRVLAAKLLGSLVLCLATTLVVVAIAALVALIGSTIVGSSVDWSGWYGRDDGLATWAILMTLSVLMASGVASLLARTAPAIVVYLIIQQSLDVVLAFALRDNADWLQPAAAMLQVSGMDPGQNIGHSLVALCLWILVPLVIGGYLWMRREAK